MNNKISKATIINILSRYRGKKDIPIEDIMEAVKKDGNLTNEDWKEHTQSRPTVYPKWRAKVQAVLHEMKQKGKVIHNKTKHTYTFQ